MAIGAGSDGIGVWTSERGIQPGNDKRRNDMPGMHRAGLGGRLHGSSSFDSMGFCPGS